MKKLRFGIIGCGRIAQRHAKHINNNGLLVSVCDINNEAADKLGAEYNASTFYDVEEFLLENQNNLDIVAICTPNGFHAEQTLLSFKYGFHVLCEKPMAISVEDCGKMINAAERANKRLFIVKQNRFNPPIEALKKAIDENRLGKIFSVQLSCFWNRNENYYKTSKWKGSIELDGGTLYTQFSHFVDLLYWLIGDIKDVYSITRNFAHEKLIDFEDTGVVACQFYNGAIGTINYSVNSYNKNMEGSITIFGEKGTVKVGGQYLNELEYQNIEDFRIENIKEGNTANDYGDYQGSMSNHDKVYENVVSVLTQQGIIATNGFEGLKTVEIIDKIYAQSK